MSSWVVPVLLLAGCASGIRTPGTEGKDAATLALIQIPAHHPRLEAWSKAHFSGVVIDGVPYDLDGETTDVWLLPGKHELELRWESCIHWPKTWWFHIDLGPGEGVPYGPPLEVSAGQRSLLRCVTQEGSLRRSRITFEAAP